MRFSDDVSEMLFLLDKYGVRYLIIGGETATFYGIARLTGAIDLLYDHSDDNSSKFFNSIKEFWDGDIPGINNSQELFSSQIVQFGFPPNRIDLINQINGITFYECWLNKVEINYEYMSRNFVISYIGLDDLIKNKKQAAETKTLST
jgi:hypothetical protein